jgi:hypothetical protein
VGTNSLTEKELVHEIFKTMVQVPGVKPDYRVVHAKGIVCQGTFTPSKDAATLSRAAHFQDVSVPVTVRLSDGNPDPIIPDNTPNAGPRGMSIRFKLPNGDETDIIALSVNGFAVSTGEEFLALEKAVVATDPTKPHPWPIEEFLDTHPSALRIARFGSPARPSQSLGCFETCRVCPAERIWAKADIPETPHKLSSLWPLPRQRVLNPCCTRKGHFLCPLTGVLTRPWVNPFVGA